MFIRLNDCPINVGKSRFIDDVQLFFRTEVVADVSVVNADIIGNLTFDGDDDGYSISTSRAEDFAAFLSRLFASRALITS